MNAPLVHEKDCTALEKDSMTLISETSCSLCLIRTAARKSRKTEHFLEGTEVEGI